ncbi:MAG: MFS transporter [Actinomycetota bacterium]|nr:MFS transporter [Actinomycetota bacterium]
MAAPPADLPIRRNTILLAAIMAVNSAVLQLVAAVSSLTFVLVTGFESLLGLGPAIFLTASALTSFPAGWAMDRYGRVPIIVVGFIGGATGCGLTALGTATEQAVPVILGFALIGSSGGVSLLIRTAAGDMYPAERRARGIAYVLSGSVVGAILGPAVFSPIFSGQDELEASVLTLPWLGAGVLSLVALVLALNVRPDPKRIAERIGPQDQGPTQPAAPLREIIRRPGVIPALLAGFASMSVMVSVMNLTGYVVVDHRDHAQHLIFPIIGAHVFGMYALVLFVGPLIDRIGRTPSLLGGLAVMAVSCAGIQLFEGVWMTGVLLFGLGLGWNISFVAATAQLADRTSPAERGKLLGFNDLGSALLGAGLALLGGFVLDVLGVTALAFGAAALVLLPVFWIYRLKEVREEDSGGGRIRTSEG